MTLTASKDLDGSFYKFLFLNLMTVRDRRKPSSPFSGVVRNLSHQ